MRIAIMQPYFFPYLGYFQLMQAVDTFVFYDDVNYIKGGWINRNRILSVGGPSLITLQTQGAGSNKLIKDVGLGRNRAALFKTLCQTYAKAPNAKTVLPFLEDCIMQDGEMLAPFLFTSLKATARFLGLNTCFVVSSDIEKESGLSGQNRVIDICRRLKASTYINPTGGRELYDHGSFDNAGIELLFHNFVPIDYCITDKRRSYTPYLSVIDFLMWVPAEERAAHIKSYTLKR